MYAPLPPATLKHLVKRSGQVLFTFSRSGGVAALAFGCGFYIGMTEKLFMVVNSNDVDGLGERIKQIKTRHETTWKEQERLIQEQERAMLEELKRQGNVITQIRVQRAYQDAMKASQRA